MRISKNVRNEVKKSEARNEFFQLIKAKMGEFQAVGFWGNNAWVDTEDYIFEGRHFKVFPVRLLRTNENNGKFYKRRTGFYMAFDMDKIESGSVVEIKVPAGKEKMFCGSGGWLVKAASRNLGVKKIVVKPLE